SAQAHDADGRRALRRGDGCNGFHDRFLAFSLILPKVYHKDEKMKRGAAAPLTDLKITSSQKKIKLAEQHDTLAYADDLKIARAHAALFILIKAEIYRKCGRYHRYDINVHRLSLLKIKI
ncbi:MAG: hypothetical protein UC755_05405, partial [Oscillospiraceae bacterium]|nr:hypothetical protein [Oscillospiraceae bacterium]